LFQQKYKNIEVIVVDQSSSDRTMEIIKSAKIKYACLAKPKYYSPPTKSRNLGAKMSKGSILVHLDSDMTVSDDLIGEIVEKFNNNSRLGALIIHEWDKTSGFWSKCKAFERRCYWGNDKIESARAVRKIIFEKVNGYDETLNSGEDFDIHRRYKDHGDIDFCENVIYHNLTDLSFKKTILKKYSYGKTANEYFKKHNTSGSSLLYEQIKSYSLHKKDFIKNPIIGLGSIFLKITEFGFGSLGLLRGRYEN
jgi:glycosyltransferase involved in cell wall biosynthesis